MMEQTVKDSFLDLEKHRQLLEDNIAKLRKSLSHWQIWDAEYDGLKEEILSARPPPSRQQLVILARDYEGDLVKGKEIEDLLGNDAQNRTAKQVVSLLDRRLDYVQQNVKTLEKQIEQAEEKAARLAVVSNPEVRDEEGLPLSEILEELDEEGNIISSQINTPGSSRPQLLEVLKKAGIRELPDGTSLQPEPTPAAQEDKTQVVHEVPIQNVVPANNENRNATAQAPNQRPSMPKAVKKGVQFTEETKPGPDIEQSQTAQRIAEIMKIMSTAKKSEEKPTEPPVIPTNESEEDAELRREMLQYGLSEVGAVVAELELEDDDSEWSEGEDSEESDEEDQFGKSTGRLISDELREQMMELENKYNLRAMENAGKEGGDYEMVREGIGRIVINDNEEKRVNGDTGDDVEKKVSKSILVSPSARSSSESSPDGKKRKKGVTFSEELDISPDPEPQSPSPKPEPLRLMPAPVSDIVERNTPAQVAFSPSKDRKQSRFKSSRATEAKVLNGPFASSNTPATRPSLPLFPAKPTAPKPFSSPIVFTPAEKRTRLVPSGPEGKTLAPTIVERNVLLNTSAAAPDEMDPDLLQQQLAVEYHRQRNRMIQRQGGFVQEEEQEVMPLTEEEGGPRKLSRFKAARLAGS